MFLKHRKESKELLLFRHLFFRNALSSKDKYYYRNLESGYAGELIFDEWLKPITSKLIFLSDLTFEINNSHFQIDSLLISPERIYLIDVKNHEGDYYIGGNKWYTSAKKEIKNPLIQLQRTASLLRQLFQYHKINYYFEASLVFVNLEFYLYEAPMNSPIIFPTQRNRFINKLDTEAGGLRLKHRDFKLAEKLLSLHLTDSPYSRIPVFEYEQIEKGVICQSCKSILTEQVTTKIMTCSNCGFAEGIEQAVLRSTEEYALLFPDKKITTAAIYDWCRIVASKRVLQETLAKNYKLIGHGKSSYYIKSL
ncbi:hypothetical protein BKP35_14685 [Anaerobacillus arseniciselenatis]|uniref:NERD domain-containing protein n=1 Tax=Anaerobacillus arseniciselenatis TaxID=85682 RepID=A0A1S2LF48_9BACI|nr:nuclease-related domain-containing protein [Anaerobacillus arseniciselenatis]OIJ10337.1 hypothetical protein BKP35_14685 [Anaerobacillus arseniciselenatis]